MGPPPSWMSRPALHPVWERIADRLERDGGLADGRVRVTPGSREERRALGDLLGRPVVARAAVTVDLVLLQERLSARAGYRSLAEACMAVTGRPLRDRPSERARRDARRLEPLQLARELLEGPWVPAWVDGVARTGMLTRADGHELVTAAAQVLDEVLPAAVAGHRADPTQLRSRVELAARVLGDAHALDENTVLHHVVVRALAAADGVDVPASVGERRALWGRYGIGTDLLSATCLSIGLRPRGESATARRTRAATQSGDPVHLTAWDLRRLGATGFDQARLLVCENPRVLEAVAERFTGAVAAVCTAGQPNVVVTGLLALLRERDVELRYHGDFDWPGVTIANRLMSQCEVVPWRMTASDYEAGLSPRGVPLSGTVREPCWDAELGAAMRLHCVAVHQESVLESLLAAVGDDADRWVSA